MNHYYAVFGVFFAACGGAALYTFLNPKQSFASMPVIDETQILVHNGQSNRFTQAPNEFFQVSLSYSVTFDYIGLDYCRHQEIV